MRADDFQCAVCLRTVDRWNRYQRGPARALAPLCRYCEGEYSRGIGQPTGGMFRDRREVMRGFALAAALNAEAHSQKWRAQYGHA